MQCQLCASFGDARFNFDGSPLETLRKHSTLHLLQIDRISKGQRKREDKTCSVEEKILNRCFPNVIAGAGTEPMNVETEIGGRRRRDCLNEMDRNNSGSKKKKLIRNNLEETKQEAASTTSRFNLENAALEKCVRSSTQQAVKSGDCRSHGIVALRSHCRELKRKFHHGKKMTCRQCSTSLVVATNVTAAVDHVTRCHFGEELYACRLCSKRFSAYKNVDQHVRSVHHKSLAVAFIDRSEEYENEIIELMAECYGATAAMEDGYRQLESAPAPWKRGTISRLASRGHGIEALRSHCCQLKRKFSQNGKMTCLQCSTKLVVAKGIINAVDHVTRCHFGQDLYACRLCSNRYSAYTALGQHSRVSHQKSMTVCCIDLSEQYENEIMELMTECYGTTAKIGDRDCQLRSAPTPQKRGGLNCIDALRSHCNELKRKFSQNGKMTCLQCSAALVIKGGSINAVDHATRCHFSRDLYACGLCSKRYSGYSALGEHCREFHRKSPSVCCVDLSEQYKNEIMELLTKCYGAVAPKEWANVNKGRNIRIRFRIQKCLRELKRKFVHDGNLSCRICGKQEVRAKAAKVVSHIARVHFRKTLFTCCHCSKAFRQYALAKNHIRKIHGLGATGNYKSHMEQHEKEIIEWMMTCFGKTDETDKEG